MFDWMNLDREECENRRNLQTFETDSYRKKNMCATVLMRREN